MQKELKKFNVEGKIMQFNDSAFKELLRSELKRKKVNKEQIVAEIGGIVGVSSSAVKNWLYGWNGPSDIDMIKDLAAYFSISDYLQLMKERKENTEMQVTERQKDSLKRIYDAVIEYLDAFKKTDGFNNYWSILVEEGVYYNQIEDKLYDIAEKEQHKVELVLSKEYIEINKLPAYSQLEEYVYDDLCEIYNGKLSYAYRFEAPVENIDGTRSGITTEEDYIRALTKINDLLEPYF